MDVLKARALWHHLTLKDRRLKRNGQISAELPKHWFNQSHRYKNAEWTVCIDHSDDSQCSIFADEDVATLRVCSLTELDVIFVGYEVEFLERDSTSCRQVFYSYKRNPIWHVVRFLMNTVGDLR